MIKPFEFSSARQRLIEHVRLPLFRNAYGLATSSLSTSALGLLYWVLAARTYPVEAVGLNTGALAVMFLLSRIVQLNFAEVLNRFVPESGSSAMRLVLSIYAIVIGIAVVTSGVFTAAVGFLAPETAAFLVTGPIVVWFVVSTAASAVFGLQDSALAGLRGGPLALLKNVVYGVIKVALVVVLAVYPDYGIFLAWTLPLLPMVLFTHILILRRIRVWQREPPNASALPYQFSRVAKFTVGDSAASILWTASHALLPLIVLERVGTEANAYFYQAWSITYAVYVVTRYFGMAVVTEGVANPRRLAADSYRMLVNALRLLTPMVVVLLIGAPYILALFGEQYSEGGTTVLRLLALSALPDIVILLYMSILRAQSRLKTLIIVAVGTSIPTLVASVLLVDAMGLVGVGIARLAVLSITAVILLTTVLPRLWLPHMQRGPLLRLALWARHTFRVLSNSRTLQSSRRAGEAILADLKSESGGGQAVPPDWRLGEALQHWTESSIFIVGSEQDERQALLKLPLTSRAAMSLETQSQVLRQIKSATDLGGLQRIVPRLLAEGINGRQAYCLERMLPGVQSSMFSDDEDCRQQIEAAAAEAIRPFHRHTMETSRQLLTPAIGQRLEDIRQVVGGESALTLEWLGRLQQRLCTLSETAHPTVGLIHGDFTANNLLVHPGTLAVTAIVDWKDVTQGPPLVDIMHLIMSFRMLNGSRDLGEVVTGMLHGTEPLTAAERDIIARHVPGDPLGDTANQDSLILLAWLYYVAAFWTRSGGQVSRTFWVSRNVEPVLAWEGIGSSKLH